ncbi:MAG TPA: hypothetical protein VGG05_19830 [Pseudonocardiaceae bacterium]|jgi:hypothetical protein
MHFVRTLLVGAAAAAAVALGAGQAFAAGDITITGAGGAFSATGTIVLGDPTSGQSFQCTVTLTGSLANVTNAPLPYTTMQANGSAHSITGWSFGGCTSSFGSLTPSVPAADLPDDLVFTTVSATAPQAGGFLQSAGTAGALFHLSVLTCGFSVAGQANFTWTNGTAGQLKLPGTGTLHPIGVSSGCFGLVSATDTLTLTGTLTVTPSSIMIG